MGGGGLQDREAKKDQHHQGNFTQNYNQLQLLSHPSGHGGWGGGLQDREAKKDQHQQGHVTQPTANSNYCYTFMGGGGEVGCKTERLKRTNISKAILHKTTINCSYYPTLQDKGGWGGGELQDREAKKDQHWQGHFTQTTVNSCYCPPFGTWWVGRTIQQRRHEVLLLLAGPD